MSKSKSVIRERISEDKKHLSWLRLELRGPLTDWMRSHRREQYRETLQRIRGLVKILRLLNQ